MDRIEQLESENRQLRAAYESLEKQYGKIGELAGDEERVYYASKKRNKFHRPGCEFAQCLIDSPNLIEFGSHREAREAGYKPCGQCKA